MGIRESNSLRVLQNGDSSNDRMRSNMISMIERNFIRSPSYKEVNFNNNTTLTGVQIVDDSTAISQSNYNSKIIIMKPNDILNVGDVIDDNGQIWICTLAELYGDIYYTGKITKASHFITLYKNSISYQIPICVESATRLYQLGVETNKYLSEPSTTIIVRMANNEITSQIKRSEIFKIGMQNYEVKDINDVIESGLLVLKMEWTAEEIVEPISPTPPQPILIVGSESVIKGKTATYTVDFAETVTFSIEGTLASIVSQSNNSCTIQAGTTLGSVKLWAKNNDSSVEGYKEITIKNLLF